MMVASEVQWLKKVCKVKRDTFNLLWNILTLQNYLGQGFVQGAKPCLSCDLTYQFTFITDKALTALT